MMLGGLLLSDELRLEGIETGQVTSVSSKRNLAGGVNVRSLPVQDAGRELRLVTEYGHVTLAQVQAVRALARAAEPVDLVHARGVWRCVITGVDMEEWPWRHSDPDDQATMSGTITMIEV